MIINSNASLTSDLGNNQSYFDTKLQELRANPPKNRSMKLIYFIDTWFGMHSFPEEVKWQILFAVQAYKDPNGAIHLGRGFSVEHLHNPDHLATLYRVFTAYHRNETKQNGVAQAIFQRHLEIIESKFKQVIQTNAQNGLELLSALQNLGDDHNLGPVIARMNSYLAEVQSPNVLNEPQEQLEPPQPVPVSQVQPELVLSHVRLEGDGIEQNENIDPTYCSTRVGFPNRENKHCGPNSALIAYAHTGIFQNILSLNFDEKHITEQLIENDIRRGILEALNQEIEQTEKMIWDIEQSLKNYNEEDIKKIRNDILNLENKIRKIDGYNEARKASLHPACMKASPDCEPCQDCNKFMKVIKNAEHEKASLVENINRIKLSCDEFYKLKINLNILNEKLTDLKNKKEQRLQKIKESVDLDQLQKASEIANKVCKILTGQETGVLTENDSQIAYDFVHSVMSDVDDKYAKTPYNGSQLQAEKDQQNEMEILRKAIYDPNWRVIRVGGSLHWWNYIRNPDGSVDMIDDLNVYRNYFNNFEQIFEIWKSPEEWKNSQITFYHYLQPHLRTKN